MLPKSLLLNWTDWAFIWYCLILELKRYLWVFFIKWIYKKAACCDGSVIISRSRHPNACSQCPPSPHGWWVCGGEAHQPPSLLDNWYKWHWVILIVTIIITHSGLLHLASRKTGTKQAARCLFITTLANILDWSLIFSMFSCMKRANKGGKRQRSAGTCTLMQ